jgi:putative pyruvate formate lyase activating enzyme
MTRIYLKDGECIIKDPTPQTIPLLKAISPEFRVESFQTPKGFIPKFQRLRKERIVLKQPLSELGREDLRSALFCKESSKENSSEENVYSYLDILYALSLSEIGDCTLCGWNCQVNRFLGEKGKCGLGSEAFASRPFIHIGEERVINPAVVTNMAGCGLRCNYCSDSEVWDPGNFDPLNPKRFWEEIQKLRGGGTPINTLEFTNPTESLPGIIGLLSQAPSKLNWPLVMNGHLFGSKTFYEPAGLITDVWLPDLRYGNDRCAKELSGVDNYIKFGKLGLDAMAQQDSRIIVRILVLPGHVSCCHEPAMELLSEYKDRIWVSVLDQYVPEHEAHLDPNLKRRPTKEEIEAVNSMVEKYGLRNILAGSKDFWRF